MQPVFSKQAAAKRIGVSRAAMDAYHMPHLQAWGIASEVAPRVWAFAEPDLTHYAEYVAAVRERKEAGTLPGNYAYSEWDMQCYIDGEWDSDE